MPASLKAIVQRGFSVVAKLPESAHPALMKTALVSAQRGETTNEEQLARDLRIPAGDATAVVSAMAMFSVLISFKEPPERVLDALIASGLVSDLDKPALLRMVPRLVDLKPEVSKAVRTQRLVDAVLPSFDDFQAELDIRIGAKDDAGLAVPIAVALLDTDTRSQRLWFQLSREDVENLIEKLNALLKRFKQAEELLAKLPPTVGGS